MGKRERNERETEKSVDRVYMREKNDRKPGQKKKKNGREEKRGKTSHTQKLHYNLNIKSEREIFQNVFQWI